MILVTAYPLGYAVVLSFYKYRLTDPDGQEFVGLAELRHRAHRPDLVERGGDHGDHHRGRAWPSSWCSGSASPG